MLYNPHDILMRRKFEEQAELQQVLDLQERRLKSLQLPDFKNNPIHHHQRSLSVGAPLNFPHQLHSHINNSGSIKGDITGLSIDDNLCYRSYKHIVDILSIAGYSGSLTSAGSLVSLSEQQQQPLKEVDPSCIDAAESENIKDIANSEVTDLCHRYGAQLCFRIYLYSTVVHALGGGVSLILNLPP